MALVKLPEHVFVPLARSDEIELTEWLLVVPQEDVVVGQGPVGELEFHQGKPSRVMRTHFPDLVRPIVQPGIDREPQDQRPTLAQRYPATSSTSNRDRHRRERDRKTG